MFDFGSILRARHHVLQRVLKERSVKIVRLFSLTTLHEIIVFKSHNFCAREAELF
jgi:hypothetical protein